MLDAIRKLGSYIIENEGLSKEAIFTEASKLKDARIICIIFEIENGSITYTGIHSEEYDSSRSEKFLYRTFGHGLYDMTPTTRLISSDKVKKRTLLWFKVYSEKYSNNQLIRSLENEINKKSERIFSDISKVYDELSRDKKNLILTIKMKEKGRENYLGDYSIFRSIFKEESSRKFFFKYKVESKGIGICYFCEKKGEVLGFAVPFSFYTFDKRGFAPNFLREDAWKRLPICAECAISLVAGKEFLNKHLLKGFYGFRFYVIPKFLFEEIHDDVITDIKDANKRKYAESLLCTEDTILDLIKEKDDVLDLIFVFIKPKQKDFFDIVQYVEDVPPSWIKKLHVALKEVECLSLFKEDLLKKIFGKKKVGGLDYDLTIGGLIRPFFPSPNYDKYFIDIIGNILAQRTIDENLLIKAFAREIRDSHVNEKAWEEKLLCLKSFMLLLFLNRLKLLRYTWGVNRKVGKKVTNVMGFFKEYKEAFDTPDKKATFLIGVLTKFLLDVQYANRGSTPFRSKLYCLKLDERRLKKLFPEIVEKLGEYNVGYPRLQEYTSEALVEAENSGWNMSKDDISYYFALGLNLGGIFK